MSTAPKLGQSVHYVNSRGEGPFAAIVTRTADTYDYTKQPLDKREPTADEVSLRIFTEGREYNRTFVPREGSPAHERAIKHAEANAPKEYNEDGTEKAPEVKVAFWTVA